MGQAGGAGFGGPIPHHGPGRLLVGVDLEFVAGGRHFAEAQGFHGAGGTGLLHPFAGVVHHRLDLAEHMAGGHHIASPQGAVLDQQRGHRTLGLVQVGFDHGALGHPVGVGLQVLHFGDQQDHLQQLVDVEALDGTHRHHHHIAAPVLGHQALAREFLLDPLGRGAFLVDLVDRDHDRHLGGPGVADRLQGLGAHAVIGGHHQHRHVGHLGAPGPHGGEGLVARGIEEGDLAVLAGVGDVHLVGADVLGDTPGFTSGHAGFADRIEQAGFAVVDVTHHGDHGRTPDQVSEVALLDHLDGLLGGLLDVVFEHGHAELIGDGLDRGQVEGLGDGGNDPLEEEALDDLGALHSEAVG